jgi:uncharacterized coiled-coil DUF342 family protein
MTTPNEEQRLLAERLLSVYPLSSAEDAEARGWLSIIAEHDAAQLADLTAALQSAQDDRKRAVDDLMREARASAALTADRDSWKRIAERLTAERDEWTEQLRVARAFMTSAREERDAMTVAFDEARAELSRCHDRLKGLRALLTECEHYVNAGRSAFYGENARIDLLTELRAELEKA